MRSYLLWTVPDAFYNCTGDWTADINGARILFGQDIHGPFDPSWGSNMKLWRDSMRKLINLNADILCEGHFGIYKPAEKVRDYIEYYLDYHS